MTWLQEQIARAEARNAEMRKAFGPKVWDKKVEIIRLKYAPKAPGQAKGAP